MTKKDTEIEKRLRVFMAYIPERAKPKQLREIIELLEKDRLRLILELEKYQTSIRNSMLESNQVFNKMEGVLVDR